MFYPSIFVGGIYNSNINASPTAVKPAYGVRLDPDIEADLDNGIYKTTAFLNVDAQAFPGQSSAGGGQSGSTLTGRLGVAQLWEATADFNMRFTLDYSRQNTSFGSTLVANSTIGSPTSFVNTGLGANASGFTQSSSTATVGLTAEEKFSDQVFFRGGVGAQDQSYGAAPAEVVGAYGGVDYTAFARGGFWVTPLVNAFVEVGGDLHRYQIPVSDTETYRVDTGFSTDMIGLFRGEIYGGYTRQVSVYGSFPTTGAPNYGASLYYYPTPYLTTAITVSDTFGLTGAPGTVAPTSTASATSQVFQALFEADYSLAEYWKASARAGYATSRTSGASQDYSAKTLGAGLSYTFWRNIALTLDDQFISATSSAVGVASYSQNVATLGLSYHY